MLRFGHSPIFYCTGCASDRWGANSPRLPLNQLKGSSPFRALLEQTQQPAFLKSGPQKQTPHYRGGSIWVRSGSDNSVTEFPWMASEGQERAVSTVQFQSVTSASLSRQRPRVRVPSSPPFQIRHLRKWRHPGIGTKRYQIGTSSNCSEQHPCALPTSVPACAARRALPLGGFASLLPNEKRHHSGLRSALFTGYGLGVGIQSDADRRMSH